MRSSTTIHKNIIYVLVFIFTLHLTPTVYINSSFLSQFMTESQVGLVYSVSSAVTVLFFLLIQKFLTRYGNHKTILAIILIELITLLVLIFSVSTPLILTAFVIGLAMRSLAFFNIDIFLENLTSDNETGGIRGIFMTSLNTAFVIGPLIAGVVLTDHDFWKIYAISSILLIPVIYILIRYMRNFNDPIYEKPQFIRTAKKIYDHCNFYGIFAAGFLLRFFFATMIIYTPIYLNQYIGFSISEVTLIIGIALIPFILLEAFLGWLADKIMGEKEILTTGFIIMAGATATMAFISIPNFWLWSAILFTTRIGASMVEIMTETYLFKKINSGDINIMSFFRIIRPIAYIVAPIFASVMLTVIEFKFLFLILGAIMLYGIRYSLAIRDTL